MGPLATNLWNSLFTMHELTEIMRQKDDREFAELLNRLRTLQNTELSNEDLATLQSRIIKPDDPNYPVSAPHLFTTNKLVDSFNNELFNKSPKEKVNIPCFDTANRKGKACKNISKTGGLLSHLPIVVDMIYEVTVNLDVADGLVNGASCRVKRIEYRQTNTD